MFLQLSPQSGIYHPLKLPYLRFEGNLTFLEEVQGVWSSASYSDEQFLNFSM